MTQLNKKIAIVTGAGNGFGEGIAQAYVREGAKVIVADINGQAANRVAESLGAQASAFTCDVTRADQVQALVAFCVATFGIPDIVVNNAGTTHKNRPMLEVDEAMFDKVFAVNVKSIFHMAHAGTADAPTKARRDFEHRVGRRHSPQTRLVLVQRLQRRGQRAVQIHGG